MTVFSFVDVHTHILPGIDDGAKDYGESVGLLELMHAEGTNKICFTPHYYGFREPLAKFLKRRNSAYEEIVPSLKEGGFETVLGAEVYLCQQLFNNDDLDAVAYGSSRFVLLELPFKPTTQTTMNMIERFCNQFSLHPVLAHINRYDIFNDKKIRSQLREMGCLFQVNLEIFNDSFFKRQKAVRLLKDGEIDFLGSDCHNLTKRRPQIKEVITRLERKGYREQLLRIYENSLRLL